MHFTFVSRVSSIFTKLLIIQRNKTFIRFSRRHGCAIPSSGSPGSAWHSNADAGHADPTGDADASRYDATGRRPELRSGSLPVSGSHAYGRQRWRRNFQAILIWEFPFKNFVQKKMLLTISLSVGLKKFSCNHRVSLLGYPFTEFSFVSTLSWASGFYVFLDRRIAPVDNFCRY